MKQSDQDPYLGMRDLMRQTARGQQPQGLAVGRVLTVHPVRVRAAGMELDQEDLKIAARLMPEWKSELKGLGWDTSTELPEKKFYGTCQIKISTGPGPDDYQILTGTAEVTRPWETAPGSTADTGSATLRTCPLQAGDEVLLLPSADGQTYYLIDKFVTEVSP